MKPEHFFLLLMAIYCAPHLEKKWGNLFGVICLSSAIMFILLGAA